MILLLRYPVHYLVDCNYVVKDCMLWITFMVGVHY